MTVFIDWATLLILSFEIWFEKSFLILRQNTDTLICNRYFYLDSKRIVSNLWFMNLNKNLLISFRKLDWILQQINQDLLDSQLVHYHAHIFLSSQ